MTDVNIEAGSQPPPTAAPAPGYYGAASTQLQQDIRGVGDRFLWNLATFYPFYYFGYDEMIFNRNDSDIVAAAKLAGTVAIVNESQKIAKKLLYMYGVSPRYIDPLQNMNNA